MQNPMLNDDPDRPLMKEDFNTEKFYTIVYVAQYNLYQRGVEKIDEFTIDSYLKDYAEQYKVFTENQGLDWVSSAIGMADLSNYDYYYHRLRKFSLLRYYEKKGLDTSFIYNRGLLDNAEENMKFDSYTEAQIVGLVESTFVIDPTISYCSNDSMDEEMAGDGIDELIDEYMEEPDVGPPLVSEMLTTLTRGCRLGCLYMRGSIQGGGKTRMAAADACHLSVPYYWDIKRKKWIYTGLSEPTVYIVAEQKNKEIKSIFLSHISAINEEHIKFGKYEEGELERVRQAAKYLKESPLIQVCIPDFSIEDIKNIMKKYNREKGVQYFFFDYIFSSMKVMTNMGSKLGMGLKEHQFLLLFSNELKTICQNLNVFMLTACQLNGEVVEAKVKDQNVLAGAKALSNKIDCGWNSTPITPTEYKKIEPIIRNMLGVPRPNMVTCAYKLRSGRITRVLIWSYYDLGIMRVQDLFVTDYDFKLIDVDITKIEVAEQVIDDNSVNENMVEDTKPTQEDDEKGKFDW